MNIPTGAAMCRLAQRRAVALEGRNGEECPERQWPWTHSSDLGRFWEENSCSCHRMKAGLCVRIPTAPGAGQSAPAAADSMSAEAMRRDDFLASIDQGEHRGNEARWAGGSRGANARPEASLPSQGCAEGADDDHRLPCCSVVHLSHCRSDHFYVVGRRQGAVR